MIQGCGVGGNVGGSNVRGAAFLGVAFTPRECYLYMQAQAYAAVGQDQAACEVLNHTKAAKRLHEEGMDLPACLPPPPVVWHDSDVSFAGPPVLRREEPVVHVVIDQQKVLPRSPLHVKKKQRCEGKS